jgi:hypothetical protein
MNDNSGRLRRPRQRRVRMVTAMTAMAAAALLAAACGGGSSSSAAAGESTAYTKAVAYAQCVRSHGVPNFPDPDAEGQFPPIQTGRSVSQQALQSAQNACRQLQPGGGTGSSQQQAKLTQTLNFARCMRSHGVPNFPDPSTSNGGIEYNMAGVDTHSPQYQSAQQACTR